MIFAEVEAVVSYQQATIALVTLVTLVGSWAGKKVFEKLEKITESQQKGEVERETIRGDLKLLQKDMIEVKGKIDLKGEVRTLKETIHWAFHEKKIMTDPEPET